VTVERTESFKRDGTIYTRVHLKPSNVWVGPETLETITVELPGGRIGEITTRVHGVPHFEQNQRAVVFLTPASRASPATSNGTYSITGLAQGAFNLAVGPDGETTYVVPRAGDMNLVEVRQRAKDPQHKRLDNVSAAELHQQTHELAAFRQSVMDIVADNQTSGDPAPGPGHEHEEQQ
jgi:hypothetical protein